MRGGGPRVGYLGQTWWISMENGVGSWWRQTRGEKASRKIRKEI